MEKSKIIDKIIDKSNCSLIDGKIIDNRIKVENNHISENKGSLIVFLKEKFKNNNFIYTVIVYIFSQSYFDLNINKLRNILIKNSNIILNIGSGNKIISNKIINLDIINYNNVDIVTSASKMCILDNKVDLILSELNIEHVYDYKSVIQESYRVLNKGGKVWYLIPFIEGFHASPYDFNRFTIKSIERNFADMGFNDIKIGVYSGPASGFLWILTEFLAILFSFNINLIYEINLIILLLLLWPIKFLDFFLNKFTNAENIAGVFYIIAKK